MKENLTGYYRKRANEYEKIYNKPERQSDLKRLKRKLEAIFENHNVLEIACGTGYWTEVIAKSAKSILAIDYNNSVIDIARTKHFRKCNVKFRKLDAFKLNTKTFDNNEFTAGFCGFWWSHISKSELKIFLDKFHACFTQNALIVMLDNRYVAGSSTPISRIDEDGNTYQIRSLENGETYEVMKNFPEESEMRKYFEDASQNFHLLNLEYYWLLTYEHLQK